MIKDLGHPFLNVVFAPFGVLYRLTVTLLVPSWAVPLAESRLLKTSRWSCGGAFRTLLIPYRIPFPLCF